MENIELNKDSDIDVIIDVLESIKKERQETSEKLEAMRIKSLVDVNDICYLYNELSKKHKYVVFQMQAAMVFGFISVGLAIWCLW